MKKIKAMIREANTAEAREEVKRIICYECPKRGMTVEMITELMYYARDEWK